MRYDVDLLYNFLKPLLTGAIVLVLFSLVPLQAQSNSPVTSELKVYKIEVVEGKEQLQQTQTAQPGDLLEYLIKYENVSDQKIHELKPLLPVPEGMEFVPDSSTVGNQFASTDGTTFSAIPLTHEIKLPDGRTIIEKVPFADYRFIKWHVEEMAAGETVVLNARVKVLGNNLQAHRKTSN